MRHTKGFTLIELMLAMSFVSILLIAIAVLTINISNIYTRGITLRDVNQAGQTISSDVERTIAGSTRESIQSSNYIEQDEGSGRLCLGNYSYAWNSAKSIKDAAGDTSNLFNRYSGARQNETIRFVKVQGDDICRNLTPAPASASYGTIPATATELLDEGDRSLAIHTFTASSASETQLFSIRFMVGTDIGAIDGQGCRPPNDAQSNMEYCAVNEFEFVAWAGVK